MKEILDELDKFFKSSFEAESGKSARKWFDHAKLTELIEEEIQNLDLQIHKGYIDSGNPQAESIPSPEFMTVRRNELSLLVGILSGIRKKYVTGEDSNPLTELDSNRYSMYSLQSKRRMLNKFRLYSESIKD